MVTPSDERQLQAEYSGPSAVHQCPLPGAYQPFISGSPMSATGKKQPDKIVAVDIVR